METEAGRFIVQQHIAIIGLGLIGGSYAKGLRSLGVQRITAVDPDGDALSQALKDGVIDTAHKGPGDFLTDVDLLIFCMDADKMIPAIKDMAPFLTAGTILTDVAGIKGTTMDQIRPFLPDGVDFVPAHPMAGREGRGYAMARADIFDGANYIIVTAEENQKDHIKTVAAMAHALGCSHVVTVTPEEHDRLIAYTSCLPHILATALVNSPSMNDVVKYFIAGSFRDATRVADINAPLWTKLFLSNKENVLSEIDRFIHVLQDVSDMVFHEDVHALTNFLDEAARRRRDLIQK